MAEKLSIDGAGRIATERLRQRTLEGYDGTHDDRHTNGQLALAAICYAAPKPIFGLWRSPADHAYHFVDPWPWDGKYDKRRGAADATTEARIKNLTKAGALIAAEIDRLLRLEGFDLP